MHFYSGAQGESAWKKGKTTAIVGGGLLRSVHQVQRVSDGRPTWFVCACAPAQNPKVDLGRQGLKSGEDSRQAAHFRLACHAEGSSEELPLTVLIIADIGYLLGFVFLLARSAKKQR
jgi:hypothetical protein